MDSGDLQQVLFFSRSVSTNQHPMNRIVLVGWSVLALLRLINASLAGDSRLDIWEPLHCEGRPVQRVGDDEVVEHKGALFPHLVFLCSPIVSFKPVHDFGAKLTVDHLAGT